MNTNCRHILIMAVALIIAVTTQTHSRGKYPPEKSASVVWNTAVSDTSTTDPIVSFNDISWPISWGVQQTGAVDASFTCYGTIGEQLSMEVEGWPYVSFETPPGSNCEHLWQAGLWIGGIVGEDTVVSTGWDGWDAIGREFHPPAYPDSGSIHGVDYGNHRVMRAHFLDTLIELQVGDSIHTPLGLDCRLTSNIWRTERYEDIVLYDLVILNIGAATVRESYIGLFCDADVYTPNIAGVRQYDDFTDDLAGSFRDRGIAYVIDNDGALNARDAVFNGMTRCLAVKLLASSHEFADTNFNWWTNDALTVEDFGPRQLGSADDPFRDFGTGGIGTPSGDKNKYYVLSHREWDYDQVYTSSIRPDDPNWCYPSQTLAANLSNGIDTKFLLSFGPVDLEPQSSLRMIFAMFTGDSIHTVIDNIYNLSENVPKYISNLYFGDMLANGETAGELADSILDPLMPVTGLRVALQSWDSVVVDWDPWCFDDVRHFEQYLSEVPADSIYYPGLVPPWLRPGTFDRLPPQGNSLDTKVTFKELEPHKFYFFNVARRVGSQTGEPGDPIFLSQRQRYPAPTTDQIYSLYFAGEAAEFGWEKPNITDLDHYNIYRFENADDYRRRYSPFYDRGQRADEIPPRDSFFIDDSTRYYYYALEPYAVVSSNDTTFAISAPIEGQHYAVTAVDNYGFESDFSDAIIPLLTVPRTQDILVVTLSRIMNPVFTTREWVNSFYHEVLDGYDYDIYYYADTMAALEDCWDPEAECFQWTDLARYKLVILDEDWRDVALGLKYEDRVQPFTKYLLSEGKLAFFGNLAGLNIFFSTQSAARYYEQDHWFVERFFGIDSLFFYPYNYYSTRTSRPYIDTCFGFIGAVSQTGELPDLAYDTLGNPLSPFILNYWPSNTAPCVSTFRVNDMGEVTHRYKARYPETSWIEGHPVGVHTLTAEAETYLFGFHLWSIQRDQARLLVDRMFGDLPTDIASSPIPELPGQFNLRQNYPNPFNPTTVIAFDLPSGSNVTLEIRNILGQKVRTLAADTHLPAGTHSIEWDGDDSSGNRVASGIYFYSLKAGANTAHRKMLLLK